MERNDGSAVDSAASIQTAPPASSDSGMAKPPTTASDWTVTPAGIGPVRVGMTATELRSVAGNATTPPESAATCTYVRLPAAPRGVSVMLSGGVVARVDVDSSGARTDASVSVGDPSTRVKEAYGPAVTTRPHKYVPGAEYLIVKPASPADSTLRIVFETDSGRVIRLRSGRLPEVEWVERCG